MSAEALLQARTAESWLPLAFASFLSGFSSYLLFQPAGMTDIISG